MASNNGVAPVERYNPVLALLYLFLLFPIAFFHAFLLGMFGKSKKVRMKEAIENEVDFQLQVEKEKSKRANQKSSRLLNPFF